MAQNTLVIDNQAANPARLDIEAAIQAVATNNSGATEPATPYENMWWYETDTNILKIRNEANNAWLNVAYLNQGGTFEVLDDTRVVNTSGTQTGLLGDQLTSTWETGTGTTESLVSPAKVKASVIANAQEPIGVGQTWQASGKSIATTYQNTTGKPIQVSIGTGAQNTLGLKAGATSGGMVQIAAAAYYSGMQCIIPDQWYYQAYNINGAGVAYWNELR